LSELLQLSAQQHHSSSTRLAIQLLVEVEVKQGLTSHQTHYRSYRGQVFTGQMTQPTVSKH